jgi:hypothetical protein
MMRINSSAQGVAVLGQGRFANDRSGENLMGVHRSRLDQTGVRAAAG